MQQITEPDIRGADTMFGIDTHEKMPESFLTDHAAWDHFMGHIWYNVLEFLNFRNDCSIVDVAPGTSIKLASALARFDYSGEIYVVDASAEALKVLAEKYAALLPKARFHWVCGPLAEQAAALPQAPDYFLGNHILDDLLLGAADAAAEEKEHRERDTFSWAAAYTHSPSDAVRESWQRLAEDTTLQAQCIAAVRCDIAGVIGKLRPRHIVLSQYPSATLQDHGMAGLNAAASGVLAALQEQYAASAVPEAQVEALLGGIRNFGNAHIGQNVLNPRHWLLCRPQNA